MQNGLVLEQPELMVGLDALRVKKMVGMDSEKLFSSNPDENHAVLEQGHALLKARGLLNEADGMHRLHPAFFLMMTAVARPETVIMTVRHNPGGTRQLVLHYRLDGCVVEYTQPEPGKHRLAILPNLPALFDRLLVILPVQESVVQEAELQLTQQSLGEILRLVQQGERMLAEQLLRRAGTDMITRALLLDAIERPVVRGTIAILRCSGPDVVAARNPAIVQGPTASWLLVPAESGSATLTLTTVDRMRLREQLARWFVELEPAPASR